MSAFATYRWPQGASLALSVVVNVEEGAEMSVLDGDRGPDPVDEMGIVLKRPIRNRANETNYRYGLEEGLRRVGQALDHHGIPATWTVAALALERAPEVARFISGRGDETASHGYRWSHQFRMEEPEEREFIRRAVRSITRTTGTRPVGHLSRYLVSDNTRRILAEEGFLYHMDDYSRDEPFWEVVDGRPLVIMPYALDTNDMKMWAEPSYTPGQWLEYAVDTFECLHAEGADRPRMMSLGLHLRVIGRPGRIGALHRFFEHVRSRTGVWVATRHDIVECFVAQVPPPTS